MKTSWGNVAPWYDDVVRDPDSYQGQVILPNIIRLINPKTDLRVLDVGCGQGFFSHHIAQKGAQVTGVDIGKELIDIARSGVKKTTQKPNPQFIVESADRMKSVSSDSFDTACCVLAIQNMEAMSLVFKEVARALVSGGSFIIVINHPTFRIPGASSWGFDDEKGIQYRRIDTYMSESRKEMDMHPGTPGTQMTYSFHRPLQVYAKNLANAGFYISRIEEWCSHKTSEEGSRKRAEDTARKEIPLFMCLVCTKK